MLKGSEVLTTYKHLDAVSGTVFVNGRDPLLLKNCETIKKYIYCSASNQLCGEIKESYPLTITWNDLEINLKLFGDYNFQNIMAAIAIGSYFDVTPESIKSALENYIPTNNRSQVIKTENNLVIMDAYNANPTSMEKAISSFYAVEGDKILVLGDMLELGSDSLAYHQELIDKVDQQANATVYLVGKEFSKTKTSDLKFNDYEELGAYLVQNKPTNMNILVKGSRGIKLENILEYL